VATYDLHQHLWPPSLIEALRTRSERPRLRGDTLELPTGDWPAGLATHELETRLAALDEKGIDVAVVSCPPTLELDESLAEAYHAGILELASASEGRLAAFSYGSALDGFAGACVPAFDVDGLPQLAPLLDELERRGAVLFVHPGPEPAPAGAPDWWPAVVGYTAQMQRAYATWLTRGADAWPNLRVLFAILAGGAPVQLERLASRGVDTRTVLHENVYLDTASYGARALELALAVYGVSQLVYGSDWPVIDGAPTLDSVRGFGQAVEDAVCAENARRLIG
jgi:predicted TIM-barrel fold metal-dependent hydrolase